VKNRAANIQPIITTDAVCQMADLATTVHVPDAILDYISWISEETRATNQTRIGVSVRGALSMTRTAKVWAATQGREYVTPDDIKELAEPVWAHRLVLDPEAEFSGMTPQQVISRVLGEVPVPAMGNL
jgi:MoxR-like ATPase